MPAKAALQIEQQLPAWKLSLALPPLSHATTQCEIGPQGDFSTKKMDLAEQQSTANHLLSAVRHPGVWIPALLFASSLTLCKVTSLSLSFSIPW